MSPEICSKEDYNERKAFCGKMLEKNRAVGHFEETALRQRLDKHLQQRLYGTIVNRYFKDGYALSSYSRYLKSGIALKTGRRYETKFFLKSLLHKKA